MHAFALFILPLAAFANPASIRHGHTHHTYSRNAQSDHDHFLVARADVVPYTVENGCPEYNKMLTAVKMARSFAQVALKEWWDEGKHTEIAATYLGISPDGYKDNADAKIVQANLNRVTLLSETHPFLSKYINVDCRFFLSY